ncbi:MAG TPA: hypothetical protein VFQ61_28385 [Polyangiaceae bacterium]|nr:hypothetical protein [Polyangiaceae bacterium]
MNETIREETPANPAELRSALYAGDLFKLAPNATSLEMVAAVEQLLDVELGPEPRQAASRMTDEEHFERVGRIRKQLFLQPSYHELVFRLLESLGQPRTGIAFDPLRLRCVLDGGHDNPRARAVYYPHRDTWYGHPAALITVWIPIYDLTAEETFVFYPERFTTPVPNNSEIFDYDEWVERGWGLKIGWQNRNAGIEARYPGVLGEVEPGPALGFSCRRGEILLFSGAQFHKTLPQRLGRTRFSLDFRFVSLADHEQGLGAPNVDSRSRGSALRDYVRA